MKLSEVTNEDGKMCAQLINLIKSGRWDLSGSDAEALVKTKIWLQGVAVQMASQLRNESVAIPQPSAAPLRIKSSGKLPSSSKNKAQGADTAGKSHSRKR